MEITGQRERRNSSREKAGSAEQGGTLLRRGWASAEWMTEPVIRSISPPSPSPESSVDKEVGEMKPPLTDHSALPTTFSFTIQSKLM